MRPLSALGERELRNVRVIAFDLDDTLLSDGVLLPSVYSALGRLGEAGYQLVAVTGRPLGYGEVLARLFPIAGVVVENGSMSVRRNDRGGLSVHDPVSDQIRLDRRRALEEVVRAVQQAVPAARFSDDMPLRRSEVTFDVGERLHLPEEQIATMVRTIESFGAWAMRSSVHVHASFDRTNKAEGLLRFLRELDPRADSGSLRHRVLFVGDSGNDAACFAGFPCTVGVANVRRALAVLNLPPRYVTLADKGLGFQELALHVLQHGGRRVDSADGPVQS